MADQELVIRISAQNLTAAEFQKARQDLVGLGGAATSSSASVKQLANETSHAGDKSSTFAGSLGKANTVLAAFGIGLSIGAIVGFGKALLDTADNIVKVADTTGMTTEEVQKLKYVAEQSGNSLEQMTSAVGKLQQNLVSGDKGAVAAVKALGLNFSDLRNASPYDAMEMIATAIAKVPDPAARSALAVELLGKAGVANLPTLISNFKELGDQAPVMSESAVRGLDAIGDGLSRSKSVVMAWAGELVNVFLKVPAHLKLIALAAGESLYSMAAGMVEFAEKIPGMSKAMGLVGVSSDSLRQKALEYHAAATTQTGAIRAMDQAVRTAASAVVEFAGANDEAAKAAKKHADELKAAQQHLDNLKAAGIEPVTGALRAQILEYHKLGASAKDIALLTDATEEQVDATLKAQDAADKFAASVVRTSGVMRSGLMPAVHGVTSEMLTLTNYVDDLQAAEQNMGYTQLQVTKAMHDGTLGMKLGLAPAIAQTAQEANKSISSFSGMKDSLKGLWEGLSGGNGITGVFSNLGKGIMDGFGNLLSGGISSLINMGVSAIAGGLKKLFGGVSEEVKKARDEQAKFFEELASHATSAQRAIAQEGALEMNVARDALLATGKTAEQAETIVRALYDTDHPKRFEAAAREVNEALDDLNKDQARARELISEYKLSIDELGPAWRQQDLDGQAQGLMNDYRLLIEVLGVSTGEATEKMAGKFNDFVNTARRTGAEVPEHMRPILQKMIDLGLLTDTDGTKFEDLESTGLTFAQTTAQAIESMGDRWIAKMDEFLERMFGVKKSIDDLPTEKVVNVKVNARQHWFGPDDDDEGFASGTPRLDFRNFGAAQRTILHGNEAVIPRGGGHQLAGEIAAAMRPMLQPGTGGGDIYIVMTRDGSGERVSRAQFRQIEQGIRDGSIRISRRGEAAA